jgi:hypothetical protein
MSEPLPIAPQFHGLEQIVSGLFWADIYWMEGSNSKVGAGQSSEINSGVPHLGWGRCFVVDKDPKAKMVTLFCPYTFEGFQVTRNSFEYNSIKRPRFDFDWDWHARNFDYKWAQAVRLSWRRDFDNAVGIMRMMDLPIPTNTLPEGMEAKKSGGKEADVLGLLKPVKRKSRKGQILAFFWPHTRSIREAMAEFGITRSNILSQLYLLTKDHGIGYELKGDQAIITMPSGCEDPYEPEAE